jgi:hypothetical protein
MYENSSFGSVYRYSCDGGRRGEEDPVLEKKSERSKEEKEIKKDRDRHDKHNIRHVVNEVIGITP